MLMDAHLSNPAEEDKKSKNYEFIEE